MPTNLFKVKLLQKNYRLTCTFNIRSSFISLIYNTLGLAKTYVIHLHDFILFGDHTSLIVEAKSVGKLQCKLNHVMSTVINWFNANNRVINNDKTHYFRLYRKPIIY